MLLELGSNQFQVDLSKPDNIYLQVIEGPNMGHIFSVPKSNKSSLGRKTTNNINFPDDQHLSNVHATFYPVEGIYYIEDMGTTNG